MPIEKLPAGTKGTHAPPALISRLMTPIMIRLHRRQKDKLGGMDLLYLTTTGARSGQRRTNPVARFEDGENRWLIVASAGGTATHPAWYHNLVAHPDDVWIEFGGTKHHVAVEQLDGAAREQAWAKVIATAPRFEGYITKTDRTLPILRLSATS